MLTTDSRLGELPLGLAAEVETDLAAVRPVIEEVLRAAAGESAEPLLRLLLLQSRTGWTDEQVLAETADRLSLREFCGLAWDASLPTPSRLADARRRLERHPLGRDLLRRKATPLLSIVSPVYKSEAIVEELVRRVVQEVSPLTEDFEIVLVDDGSPDQGWQRIEECCRADPRVRGVKLSRNFGQHAAITAGFAHARGDWVVVMDCDLQDNPSHIPALYEAALKGADIVFTVKERREHGRLKNWFASTFLRLASWLSSGKAVDPRVGAYSLVSRRVVEAFLSLSDAHRHYLVLLRWLGFATSSISIRHEARFAGRTSYSFPALVRHAVDLVVSHSDRVLYLAIGLGFAFLAISLLGIASLVIAYFWYGFREGWTSTTVLILLTTSIVLLSVGTCGIYIGKIFEQVKRRPLYLVEQVRASPDRLPRGVPRT